MTLKKKAQDEKVISVKQTILLAEDDASMRRFIEVLLKKAGYEVVTAKDGLAAIKAALESKIDAIVADAIMPNMTGYDLCRMLRQNPDKKHLPLVILSGLNQEDSAGFEDCLADVYLTKGNNLKDNLIKTLKSLLNGETNP